MVTGRPGHRSYTRTGATARQVASHRAAVPLLAFTPDPGVARRLALTWGVRPRVVDEAGTAEAVVRQVDAGMREAGLAGEGDRVVIVWGRSRGAGSTNQLAVHRVGGD